MGGQLYPPSQALPAHQCPHPAQYGPKRLSQDAESMQGMQSHISSLMLSVSARHICHVRHMNTRGESRVGAPCGIKEISTL